MGEVVLDPWCERAGMPSGTTIDQLDGHTVVPERPEELARFVRGHALGPSAAATLLVPLDEWPPGLKLEQLLSPVLARRLRELGLDVDPAKVVRLTVGELLTLPKFGPGSVIRFGCEVEAGVMAFLAERSRPGSKVNLSTPAHVPPPVSVDQGAVDGLDSSVPALVELRFGIKVDCSHARFEERGWTFQGVCDIGCGDCDSEEPFVVYRKPYITSQGSYRYWAIVCLSCQTVSALRDFQAADQKAFRTWDTEMLVEEVEPIVLEDPPTERDTDPKDLEPQEPQLEEQPSPPQEDRSLVDEPDEPAFNVASSPTAAAVNTTAAVDRVVIAAAQAELSASARQVRQVDVGRAERDDSGASTVFRVVAPSVDLSEQPPGEVFLAAQPGDAARFKVQVRYASPTEAVVATTGDVPADVGLRLYLQIDPSVVARAFAEYLEACKAPRLASVLAGRGELSVRAPEVLADLNTEQQLAAGAITSPGVSVVWGPPGTGKTRVIGAAVTELLRRGRSVALVSNTNVAVDQALLHVCRAVERFEPGEILRVGHPSIPEVSEHAMLQVAKAIRVKFRDLIQELDRLQDDLNAARSREAAANAERLDEILKGHTTATLTELVKRCDQLRERASIEAQIGSVTSELAGHQSALEASGQRYDAAREMCALWTDSLGLLEDEREVASLSSAIAASDQRLTELDGQIRDAAGAGRLRRRRLLRELSDNRATTEASRAGAIARRDVHLGRLEEGAKRGASPTVIRSAQNEQAAAESQWREAKERITASESTLQQLEVEAKRLATVVELTGREVEILDLIDRWGAVKPLIDEARRRQKAAAKLAGEIRHLSSKIEGIQRKLQDQETSVVAGAKVVGTTLAQLVLHRGLMSRTFDHLLIDEASAALPPYVYAAMTKADVGCTLVGDFEQNWPITRCDIRRLPADISPWLTSNPFGLLGIASAADASSADGCVVLRDQYRFGDQTMKLANAIAYGGLLRHGRPKSALSSTGPEIVVVDTSALRGGALAEKGPSGSGRWWGAGAALSYELAKQHGFEGVGVVAPYRHQVQLTRAQLNDGGGTAVQVGTAHAFQGREFPTVVTDLVEDGTGTSWVARANRRGTQWARDGVRLFNVAITRNAGRLYVISNVGTIQSATSGPLRDLGEVLRTGGAEVWDARSVLGNRFADASAAASVETDQHGPPRILDDREFYESLWQDLARATQRVVIFSPFVAARRLEEVLPILRQLVDRGVKVTVFTKAANELLNPDLLSVIRDGGVVVHERQGMHEKVVIVDQRVTYVGSLNTLSNTGRTDEIMLRLDGQGTNGRIAQWMRAVARRHS